MIYKLFLDIMSEEQAEDFAITKSILKDKNNGKFKFVVIIAIDIDDE